MLQKVLIIQTASLGDVILATSLAESIHLVFPSVMIDFLVKEPHEELFMGHPFINYIMAWDKKHHKYFDYLRLVVKVRRRRYDAVLNVQRFASSGLITALSRARIRSGFKKNPFSFAFTHKAVHVISGEKHEIQRNIELLKPIVIVPAEKPRLYPSKRDMEETLQYKDAPYITISPASLWFTKQLPAHKWIEQIDQIPYSNPVILLGSKHDIPLCEEIFRKTTNHNIVNLAGRLTILESVAVMKDAVMNYVNDSAPLHMASSVDAPVTAVFCSTVPSFGFGPLSTQSHIVQTDVPLSCKPCGIHGYQRCPEGHFKCAETILAEKLLLPLAYERRDQKGN